MPTRRFRGCLSALIVSVSALGIFTFAAPTFLAAQAITEYPVPSPPPTDLYAITSGPDGAVWFGESRTSKLGRVAPDGTITEYSTTFGSPPYVVVTGPDGNLWFVDGFNVGKMTPTGQVSFFSVGPTQGIGAEPEGITAGPQGALWIACQGTHQLGKVTTDGAVTLFVVPVSNVNGTSPYAIAAGPDGNLWYTDDDGDFIGRMTPTGSVQTFPVPAGTQPDQIAAGPDGAMWFTTGSGGAGRITTSGSDVQIFSGVTSGGGRIASGPDGNVWLTDPSGAICRVTPAGVVTRFPVPNPSSVPYAISAGPDGNVWFTENTANKIARVNLKAASLCTADAHTLCLNGGRFGVTATFQQTANDPSTPANAVSLTDDTGYFWFFDPTNTEMVTKVLNGCAVNDRFWFFGAGLTNVGVSILVQDLQAGTMKTYTNTVGTAFPPIQDTSAFSTCP